MSNIIYNIDNFSKLFKDSLTIHNKTQKEIAKRLSVSESLVSNWAKGVSFPNLKELADICQFLNIPLFELIFTEKQINKYFLDKYFSKFSLKPDDYKDTDFIVDELSFKFLEAVHKYRK